jgi:Na+/H+-dicarboxylate symporter
LVIVSLLIGFAFSLMRVDLREHLLTGLDVVYEAFTKLTAFLLQGLTFALFFLIVGVIGNLQDAQDDGFGAVMTAMGLFIVSFYLLGMLTILVCSWIIWHRGNRATSFTAACFNAELLLKPVSTAFFTMNSFASLPAAIDALKDPRLGYDEGTISMYLAIFLPLMRFGNALYFMVAAVFFAVVYDPAYTINLTQLFSNFPQLVGLMFDSLMASFLTIGTTSLVAIQPIQVVLQGNGLPFGMAVLLLAAVDAFIDPMRTTLIVHCNTALASLMDRIPTQGRPAGQTEVTKAPQ